MLRLSDLHASYGAAPVLQGVSLAVQKGETVALLGPNGAGKSTLLAAVTGTIPRRSGSVRLEETEISEAQSPAIDARGIALVPEGRLVFPPFTVEDNLRLGAVRLRGDPAERFGFVYELFPRLQERKAQPAGTLSGGEQQMLAIGRALMSRPRLLLLDEPFLGLAPLVVVQIRQALEKLRASGLTMLIVEQKLDIALEFAQRAYVMIKGRVVLEETTAALARRPDLKDLYFALATSSPSSARPTA
jgi:branched-chain amino acid transport system ATP-binding protein